MGRGWFFWKVLLKVGPIFKRPGDNKKSNPWSSKRVATKIKGTPVILKSLPKSKNPHLYIQSPTNISKSNQFLSEKFTSIKNTTDTLKSNYERLKIRCLKFWKITPWSLKASDQYHKKCDLTIKTTLIKNQPRPQKTPSPWSRFLTFLVGIQKSLQNQTLNHTPSQLVL